MAIKKETVKFLKNIREKFYQRILLQTVSRLKRDKNFVSFPNVTTIGIIYDASTEAQHRSITNFVKDLQNEQKKIKSLGYVNLKKMPEYCFPQLIFEFCNSRSFRWNLKPSLQNLKDFAANDFDLLIDFTPSSFYQIKNIVAGSPAHFKVGRYVEKFIELYDLMIQVDDHTPLDEVLKHTYFYLKMINNNDQGEDQQF